MRSKSSFLMVISSILGLAAGAGPWAVARASDTHVLVIAANDGYGVEDCLAEKSECGQVVADAWCEAHGNGPAVSFGPAGRFVGLVATKVSFTPDDYVVNCSD